MKNFGICMDLHLFQIRIQICVTEEIPLKIQNN
jgi:hypothetical protein